MVSTFPVWAMILLFGMIALYFVGWLNVHVPKEQKDKARRISIGKIRSGESACIKCKNRALGPWYVVLPTLVAGAASVMFFIEDFSKLAHAIAEGPWGIVVAILIYVFQLTIAEIILFMMLFFGETMSEKDIKQYYMARYGVKVEFEMPN